MAILGEGSHARGERGIERVRRTPSGVAVDERRGPLGDEVRAEASDRALGQTEQERRFISRDLALEEPCEHEGPLVGEP